VTGVCLVNPQSARLRSHKVESESTLVTMSAICDEEIADYVASGDPMDKAGAYGIQGFASRWILRIEGDYSNVVGLPVARVWRMLREAGFSSGR
jgi:septum formation protein